MTQRRRRLSRQEHQDIWAGWRNGQALADIAHTLQMSPSGVWGTIQRTGGIPPTPPKRAVRALTLLEREIIERGLTAGVSLQSLGRTLGRYASTISRELQRNGGRTAQDRAYCAQTADARAERAARRPKPSVLATHPRLCRLVARKLAADWSPAQIAGWLKRRFPQNPTMQVSHETIYRSLYVQTRGVLRRELAAHLRGGQAVRHRQGRAGSGGRAQIVGAVSISARPAEVNDRAIPGHWEGDLIAGRGQSYIATLVERSSRFVILVKVSGKDTATVVQALIRRARRLPAGVMASLTWDRGMELAQHHAFTVATDVAVYFCDPRSPWQRGTNENTNGLLRQYFPKGTDLSQHTQRQLDAVALKLNARPRKTLGFQTPAEYWAGSVALTG
jgi:IS30 family transposase